MRVDLRPLPVDRAVGGGARSARVRTPGPAATRPSRLSATFIVTNGRRRRMTLKNGAFSRSASSRSTPDLTSTPCSREIRQSAAGDERIRILDGDDGAANACLHDARRARSGAARVRARLERAIERRARARVPRRRERVNLGVRTAGDLVRAAPTTTPSASTTTAPTIGFGLVRPRPRSASAARAPCSKQSSVGATQAVRVRCLNR